MYKNRVEDDIKSCLQNKEFQQKMEWGKFKKYVTLTLPVLNKEFHYSVVLFSLYHIFTTIIPLLCMY